MARFNRHGIPILDSEPCQDNPVPKIHDEEEAGTKKSRRKVTKKRGPKRRKSKKGKTTWKPKNSSW